MYIKKFVNKKNYISYTSELTNAIIKVSVNLAVFIVMVSSIFMILVFTNKMQKIINKC